MKTNTKKTNRKTAKSDSANVVIQPARAPESLNENAPSAAVLAKSPTRIELQAEAPAMPEKVQVHFEVFEPTAKRVSLCSEFNNWSAEATPMNRGADGHWSVTLGLKPGRYQYKFLVDGHWIPDPKATENLCNEFGTLNSVIAIQP